MGLLDVLTQFGFDPGANARMARHKDTRPGVDFEALFRTGWFEEYQSWQGGPGFHDLDFLVSFVGDGAGRARFWGVYRVLGAKEVLFDELPTNVPWPWREKRPHFRYDLQRLADFEPLEGELVIAWSGERKWIQKLKNNAVLECPALHDIDSREWAPFFAEGKAFTRLVMDRQRSKEARDKCLEIHGCQCAVCGMSFPERYNGLGRGFMHVHHKLRMANRSRQYEIDPSKDLEPVCPNCHAMLHWNTDAPRAVDELRKLIDG